MNSNGAEMECKTVLVTGASSGIGQAVAKRFAASGDRVVVAARRIERLRELRQQLGPDCLPLHLDVSDTEASRAAITSLVEPFAQIDVLVNAAGVALGDAPAQAAEWADWEQTIKTNVLGLVAVTHAVLPQMVERRCGDIVNVSSITASYPYPKGHVYGASKAFVRQFTMNLRADLAGLGVRAMCIEPGTTVTEFAAVRVGHDARKLAEVYSDRSLLKPEDVAEIVHYAVSLPRHINTNSIEVMARNQTFSHFRYVDDE
jgi:3-hydroxy acid dehydrogenase / malonic semialdehyde reductase